MEEKRKSTWAMFAELWPLVKSDSRLQLLLEFIIHPDALRERYQKEMDFRAKMDAHWHH